MDLSKIYDPESNDTGRSDLDSHADTCVAGSNTIPLRYTDQKVSVSPFIGEYQPIRDIPVATVATPWETRKMVQQLSLSSMKHYISETGCYIPCYAPTNYAIMV